MKKRTLTTIKRKEKRRRNKGVPNILKTLFKVCRNALIAFATIIVLYLTTALTLSAIKTTEHTTPQRKIKCYILSNGVHTDIVVPRANASHNWDSIISPTSTKSNNNSYNMIGFGWGDRGFYLETPTWGDLKLSTAIKAATGMSSCAIHTTYLKNVQTSKNCTEVHLSISQYHLLVDYLKNSFSIRDGKTVKINTKANYGNHDSFYEANGSYSIFKTCNTWTNSGLKAAKISTATWTPFAYAVLDHGK